MHMFISSYLKIIQKPFGGEYVLEEYPDIRPESVAFVGDRLLTDVVFANLYGFKSIFVRNIITNKKDNFFAKWVSIHLFKLGRTCLFIHTLTYKDTKAGV